MFLTYQVKGLVDAIVNKTSFNDLVQVFYKIIFWGVFSFILTLYQTQRWHNFRYKLINTMRYKMYRSLIKKPSSYLDKFTTGDLASRVMNDGVNIAESAGIQILMIILNIFRITFVLCILIYFNIKLGLIVLPLIPLYYLLLRKINGKMRNNSKEEREAFAKVQQMLIENINGIKDIIMLNKSKYFSSVFDKALNKDYFSKVKKIVNCQVLMYALNNLMIIFLPIVVLLFGSYLSYTGQISIGTLIAFYTYLNKLVEPIGNLADAYQGSRMALGSADRVYDFIFDVNNEKRQEVLEDPVEKIDINIDSYSWGSKVVLNNIKFSIYKGDRILIKGESGKGKSTLLKLIMNFYTIENGSININNENISNITKNSLYKKFLELPQEPFIFEGTIKENLTLGDDFSNKDLELIAAVTCIDDFVYEKGWNYKLNESGSNLSGGQKQRLALARVLLRNPSILILDEATSALDSNTETRLLNNLDGYLSKNGISLIAVSHNNQIARLCNKELVL